MKILNEGRRFHRIALRAPVLLTNSQQQNLYGICLNFSQDGIDIEPDESKSLLSEFSLKAGDIVTIQLELIQDAPQLKAAAVKVSPVLIGLKFLL